MSAPDPAAEELKAQGNALYQRGKWGAAIDAYTDAILIAPRWLPVILNRALCHRKKKLWAAVKKELVEVEAEYGDRRRTRISDEDITEDFSAESFIPEEDAVVLVTRDGWVKRQRSINPETTRIREGDAIASLLGGSTRECVVFFSSLGSAYVCRINDIPATSGHGIPVQQLFKFKDGERVVGATTTDPRFMEEFADEKPELGEEYEEPYPHFMAVSRGGMALRFTLWPHGDEARHRALQKHFLRNILRQKHFAETFRRVCESLAKHFAAPRRWPGTAVVGQACLRAHRIHCHGGFTSSSCLSFKFKLLVPSHSHFGSGNLPSVRAPVKHRFGALEPQSAYLDPPSWRRTGTP